MPDLQALKMADLLYRLREEILRVEEERSAASFKQASVALQAVYKYHLSEKSSFTVIEYFLKNLYTSFNYGAVIVNEALKKKNLGAENGVMLEQCFETMISCCDRSIAELTKKPQPPRPKKKK